MGRAEVGSLEAMRMLIYRRNERELERVGVEYGAYERSTVEEAGGAQLGGWIQPVECTGRSIQRRQG